jgi:hypothetical protein
LVQYFILPNGIIRFLPGLALFVRERGQKELSRSMVFDQDPAFVRHEGASGSEKKEVYQ